MKSTAILAAAAALGVALCSSANAQGRPGGTIFATDQRGLPFIVGAFADLAAVEKHQCGRLAIFCWYSSTMRS